MSKLGEKERRNLFPEISTTNNFSSQTARHRRYSGPGSIMTDRQEERMMVLGAHAWQLNFDSWQMPKWQTKSVTVVSSVKASYGAAKTSGPTTDCDLNQLPRKGIWDTETKLLYLLKSIKKKKILMLIRPSLCEGRDCWDLKPFCPGGVTRTWHMWASIFTTFWSSREEDDDSEGPPKVRNFTQVSTQRLPHPPLRRLKGGKKLQPNTSLEMWHQFKAFQVESGLRCQRHGKYRCPPKNATSFQPSTNSLPVKNLLKITRDTMRAKCCTRVGAWCSG